MTVDSARLTLATWLKPLRARSLVAAVLVAAVAAAFGSRIDTAQPDAEAAGGFRMFVVGVAADSAPVQPIPEAWIIFRVNYEFTVGPFEYSIGVKSRAPVFTTPTFPGRKQFGDGPTLIGPFESVGGCSQTAQTTTSKIPLRTHGLLLPASGLPGDILLALEPATYGGSATFHCPSALSDPTVLIDTVIWWVALHANEFSGPAGAYILGDFTAPPADSQRCIVAVRESTKNLGPAIREELSIHIVSAANCLPDLTAPFDE